MTTKKPLACVRKAFTDRGLTPAFADADYKNINSGLKYICRCGRNCVSSYRRISLGMDACQACVNEKRRSTNRERYGVDAPLQNEAIRAAACETNRARYGADTPLESVQVQAKIRSTVRERYGVDHALQSKEIRERTKATVKERYGVDSSMQHAPTHRKQQKSAFRIKEYRLPSGEILEYQGYEHFCIMELLAEGVSSGALLEGYQKMPAVTYMFEGRKHVYHPDLFICAKEGHAARLIEVKSTWTLKAAREVLLEKLRASAALGYEVELRVYSECGKRLRDLENEVMLEAFGSQAAEEAKAAPAFDSEPETGLTPALAPTSSHASDPDIEALIDDLLAST